MYAPAFDGLVDVAASRNVLVYDHMAAPGVFTPRLIYLMSCILTEQVTDIYLSDTGYFSFFGERGLNANRLNVYIKQKACTLHLDSAWDADVGYFLKRLKTEHKIQPMNGDQDLCLAISAPAGICVDKMGENAYHHINRVVLASY